MQLDEEAGSLRVIAGSVGGAKGPATTFTPIELYDLRLRAGQSMPLQIPKGYNVGLLIFSGQASVEGSHRLSEAELAVFTSTGEPVTIAAEEETVSHYSRPRILRCCRCDRIGLYGYPDRRSRLWFKRLVHQRAQADYCLTVPANIAPKPATLDHTRTAVIPLSALTAWQALIDRAQLREGQRVLVHGAAGGVGSFAVQIARHKKAHVIATASVANADFVTALGANEVIDYRTTPFETVIRDVDVVLDTVGGDTRDRSWEVLSKGGRLVTIAADAERLTQPSVRDAFFIVEPNRVQLIEIACLIDTGVFRPIIGTVFAMENFRQAYDQKPMHGKHVLCIAES